MNVNERPRTLSLISSPRGLHTVALAEYPTGQRPRKQAARPGREKNILPHRFTPLTPSPHIMGHRSLRALPEWRNGALKHKRTLIPLTARCTPGDGRLPGRWSHTRPILRRKGAHVPWFPFSSCVFSLTPFPYYHPTLITAVSSNSTARCPSRRSPSSPATTVRSRPTPRGFHAW